MLRRAFLGVLVAASAAAKTVRAPQKFSFLAVAWDGSVSRARVRASRDGAQWTDWRDLQGDPHTGQSQLLAFGDGFAFVEVDSDGDLRLDFIDPGPSRPLVTRAPERIGEKPPVVSRIEWGSPDGNSLRGTPAYSTVTHLIVHHTADGPVDDYAAWVRAIWRFHVFTNGWADVGYNYLIAPDGTIFEGRAGGDNVIGAHFSCQNTGTMGVALLGDYTRAAPPAAAQDALVRLLTWRAQALELDPMAVRRHAGMQENMYVVSGHRDGNRFPRSCTVTACPGDSFYPLLDKVRNEVQAALTGRPHWTPSPGSLWRAESEGVWRYGSERTENYDTGRRNEGSIESSAFDAGGRVELFYESWYQTEDTGRDRDRKLLEMNVNNGPWIAIDQVDGVMEQWTRREVRVEAAGRVRLRFRFDSVDEFRNGYEGWRVRNVFRVGQ
jgi:hypothetical protein